ncbi:MAG: NHL repeat-containing protein, partial [Nitrospiria bacterium]
SPTTTYNNTFPNYLLYSDNGQVQNPVGIAASVSTGNDNLMIVNAGWNQILFFDQIDQNYPKCTGSLPPLLCQFLPARIISPAISGTTGIFLNNTLSSSGGGPKDRLYISNFFNNSIVVLDGASTLSGDSYSAIYKIITSTALQNPFGIFVDTSQSREWIYVVNSRKDTTGMYAVLVFDLAQCPSDPDPKRCDMLPLRAIHSSDFSYPLGVWVDETVINNQSRDVLYISNRGATPYYSPGSIALFSNSSALNGSVPATKLIQGGQTSDQTSLLTPAGILLDPVNDQLYVANEAHNTVVVFNAPETCQADPVTRNCNILPDRTIYNTTDIAHSLDGPSSVAIDFSANQMYLSTLGLFNLTPSLLVFDQAATANGDLFPINYFSSSLPVSSFSIQLNLPESIVLDTTR